MNEDDEAHDGGGDEHQRVEAEPRKVQRELLAEIGAHVVQRLEAEAQRVAPAAPVLVEQRAQAMALQELLRRPLGRRSARHLVRGSALLRARRTRVRMLGGHRLDVRVVQRVGGQVGALGDQVLDAKRDALPLPLPIPLPRAAILAARLLLPLGLLPLRPVLIQFVVDAR